jgi:recombination protein RecT
MSTEIQTTPNNGAIQKQDPQQTLKAMLERMKPALAAVLPKHVTADRMLKVVLSATARQPKLLECSATSIVRSVMQAGELGLEVGGLLGEAYLVPYNNKVEDENGRTRWEKQAQCIPGYKGLIKLARQSGQIASIIAVVVYSEDKFRVLPAEDRIEHEPDLLGEREDEDIVAVYAIARFREGGQQIDYMTLAEVNKIRARSKSSESGPWVTDFAEMARKTVVRRLCKYLPLSAELAQAIELDNEHEERERHNVVTAPTPAAELPAFTIPETTTEEPPKTRGQRLARQTRATAAATATPPADPSTSTATSAQPASSQTAPTGTPATKPGTPVQTEMPGTGPTVVAGGQSIALKPGETVVAPQYTQPAPAAPSVDDRARRLAEQAKLVAEWPKEEKVAVYWHNEDGEPTETFTTSTPWMNGEVAIIRISATSAPVALSTCQRIVK